MPYIWWNAKKQFELTYPTFFLKKSSNVLVYTCVCFKFGEHLPKIWPSKIQQCSTKFMGILHRFCGNLMEIVTGGVFHKAKKHHQKTRANPQQQPFIYIKKQKRIKMEKTWKNKSINQNHTQWKQITWSLRIWLPTTWELPPDSCIADVGNKRRCEAVLAGRSCAKCSVVPKA